jgi:hypothetical protein
MTEEIIETLEKIVEWEDVEVEDEEVWGNWVLSEEAQDLVNDLEWLINWEE